MVTYKKINGREALTMAQAAEYLDRSPSTFRYLLRKHPEIKQIKLAIGASRYIFKEDLEPLRTQLESGGLHEDEVAEIDGKQVLNMQQAANYIGVTRESLRNNLAKHNIKIIKPAIGREHFVLVEDLDKLKQSYVIE